MNETEPLSYKPSPEENADETESKERDLARDDTIRNIKAHLATVALLSVAGLIGLKGGSEQPHNQNEIAPIESSHGGQLPTGAEMNPFDSVGVTQDGNEIFHAGQDANSNPIHYTVDGRQSQPTEDPAKGAPEFER